MRNLFMTEIIIVLGHSHGHAPTQQTSYEEVKTSVTQKEKSKGICIEGYPEKYNFLLLLLILNFQPRRRSVRSNKSVLLIHVLSLHVLLIHVLSIQSVITSFNKLQQDSQKIHGHASHRRETFLTTRSVKLLFDMRRRPNITSHDTVLAQSLYGVFPDPLGQCISVTYPR